MRTPMVLVIVKGGVAYVMRKDAGVCLQLVDFDNDAQGQQAIYQSGEVVKAGQEG